MEQVNDNLHVLFTAARNLLGQFSVSLRELCHMYFLILEHFFWLELLTQLTGKTTTTNLYKSTLATLTHNYDYNKAFFQFHHSHINLYKLN